jgi:WD40 repeat protein
LCQEAEHSESVLSADISRDGSTIATGGFDGTVRLWNAESGVHLRMLDKGSGWVRYVEFFPDGKLVALGRELRPSGKVKFEGEAKICRVADGKVVHHFPVSERVMCGALSPDGKLLAAGIGLGEEFQEGPGPHEIAILVWDTTSGCQLAKLKGHKDRIQNVRFTEDGKALWSSGNDQALKKWSIASGKEMESHDYNTEDDRPSWASAVFIPGTERAVFTESERIERDVFYKKLTVRELADNGLRWEKKFPNYQFGPGIAVSRDGTLLAASLIPLSDSNAKRRAIVLSADDGQEVASFALSDGAFRSLTFSRDSNLLITGMVAGDALLWDLSAARKTFDGKRQ